MIIGEDNVRNDDMRILELECDLAKAREEVAQLTKALINAHDANCKLSAEIADLRYQYGVSINDIEVTYEWEYE